MAKFSPFREELRRAFRDLRGGTLSPARGAASVALGLFVGTQPIFGCHLPAIVVLCLWMRLDAVIAYVAANISNPFFAPVIITAEVIVGAYLRTGAVLRFDRALTRDDAVSSFARDLAIGAPVVGLALAIVGFFATYSLLTAWRRFRPAKALAPYRLPDDAPPWVHAVERVASRYSPPDGATAAERSRFHYVRIKLLGDPIAKMIAGIAGEEAGVLGEVVDVGTGRGQLPILLLELGRATRAHGFDWDRDKVEAATRAAAATVPGAGPLPFTAEAADMREAVIPAADTVLLVDVLHYISIEAQDALLDRAAAAVRPGGRLLVREADTERGLRSAMTLLEEKIFTALRYNRGERVRFRPAREIAARLEAAGLSCEVRPAWGKTPFSNVLVLAKRPR